MSLFKRFAKKKKEVTKKDKTQQVNDAIYTLKDQISILNKRKECDEKKIAALNCTARQCMKNKDKKGALSKLRLRKKMEARVESVDNQIFNLEVQIMTLEESVMNQGMMDAMKVARDAMQKENTEDLLDQIEETQEDIKEALELQREFDELISTPLVDFDDDELEAELAELDDEVRDNGLIYGHNHSQKSVKNDLKIEEPVDDDENEEIEMKKMEIEMNMASRRMLVAC